jgi:replicative DNA helicase
MAQPSLLNDTDKYLLEKDDFPQTMDKYIFSAIYNLYTQGAEAIRTVDIVNYLDTNSKAKNLIEKENGISFLQDCENECEPKNFSYYYNNLKKLNLLKDLQRTGKDVSNIYCEDVLSPDYNKINDKFETMTPNDIINLLKSEVANYEKKFVLNNQLSESRASDNIRDLIKELKEEPEVGCPLQGDIFNTICRGGRKGKMYLRSAGTSVGKTRQMVGDCCCIAYPIRYDINKKEWVSTGNCEKVLYVMTEQDPEEIKTMILAYLTGYNEEIFLYGNYREEHMERIKVAISIMEKYKDNVLFARIPDPSSSVIKNLFRRYNLQYGVENFFYDYIFSSPAMLEEYRDLKLPEHVCLRLFTTALKNLAVELNSFIMTSTQISGDDDPKGGFRDYKKVRGSRSIADLVDVGCIMSRPTREELQPYSEYISSFGEPNLVIDVYKNRRGRWNMVRIFCKNDLGICRRKDLFITDAQGRILTDFNLANYSVLKNGGFNDELNLYNTGEVSDSLLESSCAIEPKETENLTADDIKEAFGTLAEKKDWDDML